MKLEKLKGFSCTYAVEGFWDDFLVLVKNNTRYIHKLYDNLAYIEDNLADFASHPNFERLEKDIYSIRHPRSKLNERVIFTIGEGNELIILLTSLKEKSKSDYARPIEKAKSLIRRMKEEAR